MAHFAKLDDENKVLAVVVVKNEILVPDNEEISGIKFLTDWSGGHTNWKQTSINTYGNIHILGGKPFRKNYATVGSYYDEELDGFISPKPDDAIGFDSITGSWIVPEEDDVETV
jgi:hypothetical protein